MEMVWDALELKEELCNECGEKMRLVVNEAMGVTFQCVCGCSRDIAFGDSIDKLDGIHEGAD
jgi:hypothetical protein